MKKSFIYNSSTIQYLTLASLVCLPGCSLFESFLGTNEERAHAQQVAVEERAIDEMRHGGLSVLPEEELTGQSLITMDGTPIVTVNSLQSEKEKLLDANPQLKQMLDYMDPAQLDRNLAEGLMNQVIVDRYIGEQGIDQMAAYKKELRDGIKAVERMVNTKFFTQSFDVKISDADTRAFYDANKDAMPHLIVSRGGVRAMGVPCANEADARVLADVVKAEKDNIQKAAEMTGKKDQVRDFMTVNQQSFNIEPELKNKIMAITNFPSVNVVTLTDGSAWVVLAQSKEAAQYRPYDEVKDDLKDYLEKEARAKQFDEEMSKLKARYNVKMNEEFFGTPEQQAAEAAAEEAELAQLDDAELAELLNTVAYQESSEATA
jgi:peptidyl-prolyl cis-trans isomerase C